MTAGIRENAVIHSDYAVSRLAFGIRQLKELLSTAILATPTGERRNLLCDQQTVVDELLAVAEQAKQIKA